MSQRRTPPEAAKRRRSALLRTADTAPPIVHDVLHGAGQALPTAPRAAMEQRFGHDFSHVRVHADAPAAASARALDAAAFTVGRDVVFGAGQFAPTSPGGERLLAHELAHVVQQGGAAAPASGALAIGAVGDAREAAADRAAEEVVRGRGTPALGRSAGVALQRQPLPGDAAPAAASLNLATASIELSSDEAITPANPKLVELAAKFKGSAGDSAHIEVSAMLSAGAQTNSAGERAERARLVERMQQVRSALVALGVPKDRIDTSTPTAYATSAHGQVSVDLRAQAGGLRLPLPGLQGQPGGLSPTFGPGPVPPAPASTSPSLAEMLTLKFGPVTIELPKSVTARLPIALSVARSLVIELKAEAPAKFSFKLTLDGTPHVRVSAVAGAEYDTDKKVATGSAGLQIESVRTTCHAVNPEETRTKITAAGAKLMKASTEYSATKDAATLIDIAGAIGEMYDAVDKAKAACKQVPRFKFEFGVKGPLGSGDETDPSKRTPSTIGGTLTIPF